MNVLEKDKVTKFIDAANAHLADILKAADYKDFERIKKEVAGVEESLREIYEAVRKS